MCNQRRQVSGRESLETQRPSCIPEQHASGEGVARRRTAEVRSHMIMMGYGAIPSPLVSRFDAVPHFAATTQYIMVCTKCEKVLSVLLGISIVLSLCRNSPKSRHLIHFNRPRPASRMALARSARTSLSDAPSPQEQTPPLAGVSQPQVQRIAIR